MKIAKVTIQTVVVSCPYCGEGISDPNYGSLMWEMDYPELQSNSTVCCDSCGEIVKLPKNIRGKGFGEEQ